MKINGKNLDIKSEITVIELLTILEINKDKVVVEINGEIIPLNDYSEITLKEDDTIEVISFVGGG